MGPTPTPTRTLGVRLSCHFVNVYTRASATDIIARKSVRRSKVRGQVGELNGPRAPRQADCRGAARADFRARILARKSARKSVSVSVSVPWNLSFITLGVQHDMVDGQR